MKRLVAIAVLASAMAIAVAQTARAQNSTPFCRPGTYYNTAVGQCVTESHGGGGNR